LLLPDIGEREEMRREGLDPTHIATAYWAPAVLAADRRPSGLLSVRKTGMVTNVWPEN